MPAGSSRPSFLPESGEAVDVIHRFDWSKTSLGSIESWSVTIQTVIATMLRSPVAIATMWGDDGVMIYNDAYAEIAGKRHPGLMGANIREGWPEAADFNDHVMKAVLAGKTLSYKDQEFTLYRNGTPDVVWLDLDYSPVADEDGTIVGVFAVLRDTSERVKAARQLEALNEDLERQVLERVLEQGTTWNINPDMLAVMGMDGRFLATNPAWGKTLGYTAHEMRGFTYSDLLHPDDIADADQAVATLMGGEAVIEVENRYRTKDGAYRWFSWVCVPENGKIYCIIRDVTNEKTARAERDQLWRLSQDMLARASYDGELSAVNPAWGKVLGWSEQELLTNPYVNIIHPEDVPRTTAALVEMAKTAQPTKFENRILTKSGVWTPIGWTVSPEADNVNFIAVGRDLSDYKAREEELADAQEQLRQAQKIEAIGQLTGGLAHDFNNILAGMPEVSR